MEDTQPISVEPVTRSDEACQFSEKMAIFHPPWMREERAHMGGGGIIKGARQSCVHYLNFGDALIAPLEVAISIFLGTGSFSPAVAGITAMTTQ